jgi:hypothetical protein
MSQLKISKDLFKKHANLFILERAISSLPQVECPIDHSFCNGLYARTMSIPAGTVVTGAIHAEECFFLVRYGTLAVTTDDGVLVVNPGDMLTSKALSKRAVVTFSNVIVTTFHPNPFNETNEDNIWKMLVVDIDAIKLNDLMKEQEEML